MVNATILSRNANKTTRVHLSFQVLRDNMFAQFTQLKSLDLQQNRISRVEDDAFSGLSQLKTLLLQHNQMTTASEEVLLPLPRLTYLRLYDNPWSCLCPLESLIRKLQLPGNRNLGNYAICAEPLSLKGQKLKKLTVDLLCEEDKGPEPGVVERPKPPPKIGKPDATSMCRTYMFPKPLLDCSNKGERLSSSVSLYLYLYIVTYSLNLCLLALKSEARRHNLDVIII